MEGGERGLMSLVLETLNSSLQWFIHRKCPVDNWKFRADARIEKDRSGDIEQKP